METFTAVISSPLGHILLTATEEQVTEIKFVGDALPLQAATSPLLQVASSQLREYFAGSRTEFSFPFGQEGTLFQQRVWAGLLDIPFGKTISYKTMAIRLGDEKCIRAAGTANGKNQLAIVVPCHRVVGANGALVGYAGELWRKQWLLEHEAKHSGLATQSALFG
ncbi:MAG: methylated-DNA--[protein]-cysteine S-methyltransferase [Bacteroidetes bacterium]|jgi:O-6-methylguanine DNA methyltransferase|uniref:methylated-DNA--[protein]-cysteine S-methyltransferase n=1 Tax=Phnomibacter sp. TaxID=2836217 RepID=UPI002FDCC159|nr:methylated-DNA--[protein]-cysteine S-methyltransferase [Bacteroidota bacterium]